MAKGWYGHSQRHSMSSKGVKSSIIVDEKSGVWFESNGILADVITLLDSGMGGLFANGIGKGDAKGYTQEEYYDDASKVVLMPTSRVDESIEWLEHEYAMARTQERKMQLQRLVRMTLNRLLLEMKKENPKYVQGQLVEAYKRYTQLFDDIKQKQRMVYA